MRVITRLNIGGPAIHVLLLVRGLSPFGYSSTLITGRCEAEDGDMSYLLRSDDVVSWLPELSRSVRPWRNLRALWRLWRLMRRERPDIVHTHTAMAGCIGRTAAILAGVPAIVHTFHGNSLRHYFSPLTSTIFLLIEKLLARATDAICVVSPQQIEELSADLRIAPRRKFHVVRLGLDLDRYLSVPDVNTSGPKLRVAWVGRLVAIKNISLLVRVIEETLRRTERVEFVIAGDGPDRSRVEDVVSRFPAHVRWAGWQQDIRGILEAAGVLLQTSLNEGTPLALIQGMAAARPFVSTPVGGVVDMVSGPVQREAFGARWYRNAILAPADPAVFADLLAELAVAPSVLREMGAQARDFARGRHGQARLISDLDSLYRELLSRKSVPCAAAGSCIQ